MKKTVLLGTLMLTMALAGQAVAAEIRLEINGDTITPAVAPVVQNGTTLVPLRVVSERLGAQVHYESTTKEIMITKEATTIQLRLEQAMVTVDGNTMTLAVAPQLMQETTMIPIRFVSEQLGAYVNWDAASSIVQIEAEVTPPTSGELGALEDAKSYLRYAPFSYDMLVLYLEYDGYTTAEATYAVKRCEVDWNKQGLAMAHVYLGDMAFSYRALEEELKLDLFTTEQVAYAMAHCGADWNEQAVMAAQQYLDYTPFSYDGLREQLEFEQFTAEQAKYGVDNCGADWKEQAVAVAQLYLIYGDYTRQALIDQLVQEGFGKEQAEHGAATALYNQKAGI